MENKFLIYFVKFLYTFFKIDPFQCFTDINKAWLERHSCACIQMCSHDFEISEKHFTQFLFTNLSVENLMIISKIVERIAAEIRSCFNRFAVQPIGGACFKTNGLPLGCKEFYFKYKISFFSTWRLQAVSIWMQTLIFCELWIFENLKLKLY